jgi:hypothetical protein
MDALIKALRELETSDLPDSEDEYLKDNDHPTVSTIRSLADNVFITKDGVVNWNAIQESGYCVFPIERDRFGWLLGGIETTKGIISFG